MIQYIVVQQRAWRDLQQGTFGVDYFSDLERFDDRSVAISHGFTVADCDDYNIGTIRNDRLIAFGWMCKDFEKDDHDELATIAERLGLEAGD